MTRALIIFNLAALSLISPAIAGDCSYSSESARAQSAIGIVEPAGSAESIEENNQEEEVNIEV